MNRNEELSRRLKDEEEVLLAYLFGSCVRGDASADSDVDVAVLLKDDSWDVVSKLMDLVADALKVNVERVDILNLAKADVTVKIGVIEEGLKLLDRGDYESRLYEELCGSFPDSYKLLWNHMKDSVNPLRKELVISKLMSLDEEVSVLKTYVLGKTRDEATGDPMLKRVLRDSLRVAIESMMDICKHLVASMKLGVAREYRDYPTKLWERGLLSRELSERLVEYAKLRNILVHRYAEADFSVLYGKAVELVNSVAPQFRGQMIKLTGAQPNYLLPSKSQRIF